MEKILVALNPRDINTNMVDFACYLASLTHSELTAIFLDQEVEEGVSIENHLGDRIEETYMPRVLEKKSVAITSSDNSMVFQSVCKSRGIRIKILHTSRDPLSEILFETRFADLLVLDQEKSFVGNKEVIPSDMTKSILANSECPVVITPFRFHGVDEILFAYDGSASAAFAMKQFSYLFPELADLKLTILQVSKKQHTSLIEKKKLIEFLQMHYCSIGFRILEGKASKELQKYLQAKKNAFVVIGAFGRKNQSALLRSSTAEPLLGAVNLPLFIAHP